MACESSSEDVLNIHKTSKNRNLTLDSRFAVLYSVTGRTLRPLQRK